MNTANMVKIFCTNINQHVEVPMGLTLGEIAQHLGVTTQYTILGAIVNNKNVGLTYRLYQPKRLTFFDITHPEGLRTYIRSLIFILYAAVKETLPSASLCITHSVSNGLYCELKQDGRTAVTDEQIAAIVSAMRRITAQNLPITRHELEIDEALKLIGTQTDKAALLKQHGDIYTTVHHMGQHASVLYGDLVPATGIVDVYDLKPYYNGMLLQLPKQTNPEEVADMIRQDKMFATFVEFDKWMQLMNIQRLPSLNMGIELGRGQDIIQVAEALHEKKIVDIAGMIAERKKDVKIVLIAGPSSSGKTTFGKRLAVQLIVNGIRPVNLSLDNYFVNREDTPRDENGDYDFEAVEAIDIELFNQQLLALMAGEEVKIPKFNFETGSRFYDGETLQMGDNHVLIIEGTHGLTPQLTHLVPADAKFGIYIAPLAGINFDALTRINTTDNRLIRRIVRDYKYRGYTAQQTIARWPSVRRGEDKHIYPNQEQADVMFNSALLYEMAVLKAQAEPILLEVAPNMPEYAEARRLLKFLSYFKPLSPDSIPPTSILREFLGGSSFRY